MILDQKLIDMFPVTVNRVVLDLDHKAIAEYTLQHEKEHNWSRYTTFHDMKLNELHDNEGASRKKKRIGRGPGSGKGKTGGRGMKGQKSRSGVAINGYEGGQMPLYQRLPKRGFNNPNRKSYAIVNLSLIEKFIDAGKLDAKAEITEDKLVESGLVRRKRDGVRILSKGELKSKIKLNVTGASKAAIDAVAKAGGSLTIASSSE